MLEFTTETGIDVKVLDGQVEDGELGILKMKALGEEIESDSYLTKEDAEYLVHRTLLEIYDSIKNENIRQTDLRYEGNRVLEPDTRRMEILDSIANRKCATSRCISKDTGIPKNEVSSALTVLRRKGLICITGTDGNGSYQYVLTHVGMKERIEAAKQ